MPKREERRDLLFVVVAVADKKPFAVINFAVFAGVVDEGRVVFQPRREGGGQLARRRNVAKENIGQGVARLLAAVPALQDGRRRRPPRPFPPATRR
jgi:hypothetical protein